MPTPKPPKPSLEESVPPTPEVDPLAYRKDRPPVPPNMLGRGDPLKPKAGNTVR